MRLFNYLALVLYFCFAHPISGVADTKAKQETVVDRNVEIEKEDFLEVPYVPPHSEGMPSQRIDIGNGVELFVIEEGEGTPIVLLNGGPGNSLQSFIPHLSKAAEFSRVIYYDPRGVGKSDWEPGPEGYSTVQAINDLEILREKLGIEKWVVLGWSWGGLLAQLYSIQHPEHVLGLVLLSSSTSMNLELEDDAWPDNLSKEEKDRIREILTKTGSVIVPMHTDEVDLETVRLVLFNTYYNGGWKNQFYLKPSKERIAHVVWHEWVHDKNYNKQMRDTGFNRNLAGCFKAFPLPVLAIYGAWDTSFPRELPFRLANEFPKAKTLVFENSSHNSFASEPDRFFSELEKFVKNLKEPKSRAIVNWKKENCLEAE